MERKDFNGFINDLCTRKIAQMLVCVGGEGRGGEGRGGGGRVAIVPDQSNLRDSSLFAEEAIDALDPVHSLTAYLGSPPAHTHTHTHTTSCTRVNSTP